MKLYQTLSKHYPNKIIEVEADRATLHSVFVGGKRIKRNTGKAQFHESKGDAAQFLVQRAQSDTERLSHQLERATIALSLAQAVATKPANTRAAAH